MYPYKNINFIDDFTELRVYGYGLRLVENALGYTHVVKETNLEDSSHWANDLVGMCFHTKMGIPLGRCSNVLGTGCGVFSIDKHRGTLFDHVEGRTVVYPISLPFGALWVDSNGYPLENTPGSVDDGINYFNKNILMRNMSPVYLLDMDGKLELMCVREIISGNYMPHYKMLFISDDYNVKAIKPSKDYNGPVKLYRDITGSFSYLKL